MKLARTFGTALLALGGLATWTAACNDAAETTPGPTGSGGSGGDGGSAPVCEAPLEVCGEACVDTQHDPAHCGGCDAKCPDGSACLEGKCTLGPNGDGEHCTSNADCRGGVCLTEDEFGLAKGMCATLCNTDLGVDCPDPDSVCSDSDGVCLKTCTAKGAECPAEASTCVTSEDAPDEGFCLSTCTSNADCPTLGKCNTDSGRCEPPENCGNATDDDGDTFTDCEDDECAKDATCKAAIDGACKAPGAATEGFAGDTSKGTSVFFGSCTGAGAKEQVLTFTSGAKANVTAITVTSKKDLGFYVRTTCASPASERVCNELYDESKPEKGYLFAKASTTYDLFVDGFDSAQAGAFTLGMATLATVEEVEPNANSTQANTVGAAGSAGVFGTITKGDEDFYAVTVPAAGKLFVQTVGGAADRCGDGVFQGNFTDTEVELFDVDGTTSLGVQDDISGGLFGPANYCTVLTVDVPKAGKYFVRVAASQAFCAECAFDYAAAIEFTAK